MSKPVGALDKRKGNKKGLSPKDRTFNDIKANDKKELTANQWQSTPRQNEFMQRYLLPSSDTFGNAYQSALASGYSKSYALIVSTPSTSNKWISEYMNKTTMTPEHVIQGLQDMYLNPKSYNNSRSPADTRVKVLELLAKVTGIVDNKHNSTTVVVTPILGGASASDTPVHVDVIDQ